MNETNDAKKLITLEDYKNAGVFETMPNGFELYDDVANEIDGCDINLTRFVNDFYDCKVTLIAPDPFDCCLCAVYINTSSIRKNIGEDEFAKRYLN
jgi:hypothetical protein